jgi:hypothetical protein
MAIIVFGQVNITLNTLQATEFIMIEKYADH